MLETRDVSACVVKWNCNKVCLMREKDVFVHSKVACRKVAVLICVSINGEGKAQYTVSTLKEE